MRLESLRTEVLEANLELVRRGLVLYTFGNASGISRSDGLVVIKPSGVPYENLRPDVMVITDLDGKIVEGSLRPSSDLATHLELYKAFPKIGGVAHTHSEFATAWAQARKPIPCFGTTHADYFHGPVPVTDLMSSDAIAGDYEKNTGAAILSAFREMNYERVPAPDDTGESESPRHYVRLEFADHDTGRVVRRHRRNGIPHTGDSGPDGGKRSSHQARD
jgi:L-ribulose-5-phosphate 4-epimerase